MISITMTGLNAVIKKLDFIPQAIQDTIMETGKNALIYAKEIAPVAPTEFEHSGMLRDSLRLITKPNSFTIYSDAKDSRGTAYAHFNEYGGHFTPAGSPSNPMPARYFGYRPFIRVGILKARQEVEAVFGKKMYRLNI